MTVGEVYKKYRIHRGLQLHQLRAAAVAKCICNRFKTPIDSQSVVVACLFHDMGNIIKSDMTSLPDLWEPEGAEYWSNVKGEFIATYGDDVHKATMTIAGELGLAEPVLRLINSIGFSGVEKVVASPEYEPKICDYADVRTGTHGVLSMRDRLENWHERYVERLEKKGIDHEAYYLSLVKNFTELENQLMQHANFNPTDISDESIASIVQELKNHSI